MTPGRLPFDWFKHREGTAFRFVSHAVDTALTLVSATRIPPPWPDFGEDCYHLQFAAGCFVPQGTYGLADAGGEPCTLFLTPGAGCTMHASVM